MALVQSDTLEHRPAHGEEKFASPLRSSEKTIDLPATNTKCVIRVSMYSNRVMLTASATGTFGTIVEARKDVALRGGTTYSTKILLGNREDDIAEICARQIVEKMDAAGCELPLLLCLGLSGRTMMTEAQKRDIIGTIVAKVMEVPLWQNEKDA